MYPLSHIYIPDDYVSSLTRNEIQHAIELIKQQFQTYLCSSLNLTRVSAPLFLDSNSGLNDDLSGVERAVSFDIPDLGINAQVVHSLAKWKRMALSEYEFSINEGLYADMNAIRRDEIIDNLHSVYVDQWDWERIITKEQRNIEYLQDTVLKIVDAIIKTHINIKKHFPSLTLSLSPDVYFISSQELENLYPNLTPENREFEIVRQHKTVFITQIGYNLSSGKPHGNRAPDYDDWALNGDLLFWSNTLNTPIEISSMGIRVDKDSLIKQLDESNCRNRMKFKYHKMIQNQELPLTIGGGIGQSRLCMLLLGCAHIGEVQSGLWDSATIEKCKQQHINLL